MTATPGPGPDRIHDQAGQLERTALAWNRSVLALAVNGALLMRAGQTVGSWAILVGAIVLMITLPAWLMTSRAYRRYRGRPAHALLARGPGARIVVVVALGVGIADLAAILAYP